jgi:hypothetical protein
VNKERANRPSTPDSETSGSRAAHLFGGQYTRSKDRLHMHGDTCRCYGNRIHEWSLNDRPNVQQRITTSPRAITEPRFLSGLSCPRTSRCSGHRSLWRKAMVSPPKKRNAAPCLDHPDGARPLERWRGRVIPRLCNLDVVLCCSSRGPVGSAMSAHPGIFASIGRERWIYWLNRPQPMGQESFGSLTPAST